MKESKKCLEILKNLCGYIDNELTGKCCEEIEAHLRECPECRGELKKMESILSLCKKSRESLTKTEKKRLKENIFNSIEKE
ncbi:TPA: hypothetical protein DCW38_04295 [candidate division WOR-3 bacterium]|jgi:anti-sigma factor RsiW|uniref:Putative zinc-finger domain-containing protein n=1 Tax=candidate division WOR-3 bacterium TaxID=2052148 RepID=A0A350HA17_UNCW3|nr:hypothetical protein [candidate division WOR-3 bacterium]